MDVICRRLSWLYYTKSTSKAGERFIEARTPRRRRGGSGCCERGFLDAGDFSGGEFHECETLSAEILERCADEIDILVVDDEKPVMERLIVPDGKLRVLGVEGRNVCKICKQFSLSTSPSLNAFAICLLITDRSLWNRTIICSWDNHTVSPSKQTESLVVSSG